MSDPLDNFFSKTESILEGMHSADANHIRRGFKALMEAGSKMTEAKEKAESKALELATGPFVWRGAGFREQIKVEGFYLCITVEGCIGVHHFYEGEALKDIDKIVSMCGPISTPEAIKVTQDRDGNGP